MNPTSIANPLITQATEMKLAIVQDQMKSIVWIFGIYRLKLHLYL